MSSIIANETKIVPINSLKPYDKNPRIGDVGAIAESLEENQQYRPIVVQKSTQKILAGNHTWQAAKFLGWETIAVVFVDVDDTHAAKIVLADNRTNDLASYDAKMLTEVLASLPDVAGTGYSQSDLEVLLDQIEEIHHTGEELTDDMIRSPIVKTQSAEEAEVDDLEDDASSGGNVGGINRPNFADDLDVRQVSTAPDQVDEVQELRYQFEMWEAEIWPTNSEFGIPMLDPEMLVEELPDDLDTWVGAIHHDREDIANENKHWLYNYGVGIKEVPFDRCFLAFYVQDEKFENWWHLPAYYVAKMYSAGIRNSIVPDYSNWDDWPQALNIYNVYRNFWLGRFFQQCGWRVIPSISFNTLMPEVGWSAIPANPPVAAIQLQTVYNKKDNPQGYARFVQILTRGLATIKPGTLIVYSGNRGREVMADVLNSARYQPEIVFVDSFAKKKTDMGVFERERPTGTKRSMTGQKPEED